MSTNGCCVPFDDSGIVTFIAIIQVKLEHTTDIVAFMSFDICFYLLFTLVPVARYLVVSDSEGMLIGRKF